MTQGLVRWQRTRDLHFVTFSCYRREPYLADSDARAVFERSLERMRVRYKFFVSAYVVMPEHVHLLMSEPRVGVLATALQAVKLSVTKSLRQRPFWQKRYFDFNVWSAGKVDEKIHYIHWNPVRRGLVEKPEDWVWSSARCRLTGEQGIVDVLSPWTERRYEEGFLRERGPVVPGPPKGF